MRPKDKMKASKQSVKDMTECTYEIESCDVAEREAIGSCGGFLSACRQHCERFVDFIRSSV